MVILADDLGYSDIGCYGGEIQTPHLDRLAANGLRFSQFYNTSKCWTSRASLLTGKYWQRVTVGNGLKPDTRTVADRLKPAGYSTYLSGKWHLDENRHEDPSRNPLAFGFDRYFGNLHGAVSYFNPYSLMRGTQPASDEIGEDFYLTDAIAEDAVKNIRDHFRTREDSPLFLYVAFTAPHWPLHARPEDIARYEDFYRGKTYSDIRYDRYRRMRELGVLPENAYFSDPSHQAWNEDEAAWNVRRMAVYAAMVDSMDRGIGRILSALEAACQLDNSLICFLTDNGSSPETIAQSNGLNCLGGEALTKDGRPIVIAGKEMPGDETTFQGYGPDWANVSNTPYRWWKATSYEGGIRSPFILYWPPGIPEEKRGSVNHDLSGHLIDLAPSFLELAGETVPADMDGLSLADDWKGSSASPPARVLFNDFGRSSMAYAHPWKLVLFKDESYLYNLETDPVETLDLSTDYPNRFRAMRGMLADWMATVR